MFPSFFTLFQAAESLVMQTKDAWIIHQVSHIQHRLEDHYLTINMILRPRNGGNGRKDEGHRMARRAHLRDCNPSLSSETFRESQTYHDQRSVHVEHHVHNPDPAMVQQQQCSNKGQVEAVHAVSQAHVVAETSRAEPSDPKGAVGSFLKIESTAESGRIFGKGWGQKPRCFEWYNRAHGYRWQAAQVEQGHEVAGSTYLEALDDGIGHKDVLVI